MSFRHLIEFDNLSTDDWNKLYAEASRIIAAPEKYVDCCHGKVSCNLFYEPSTRTNFSFQTAMMRLGGSVFGFADPNSSSVAKGESLKDTIKMVSGYADIVVIRSPQEGAAKAASLYSDVPVINAGDGGHMHPTQTLTDLTTIMQLRGSLDDMCVGLCGDLKNGRTVHSLITALSRFKNTKFYLISPRELAIPDYMRGYMKEHGLWNVEVTNLDAVIPQLDVLYMTRIQKERFTDMAAYERNRNVYILTEDKVRKGKKDLLVMHPLPRVNEIAVEVDDDPRAAYFRQARFGMYIRMALLKTLIAQGRMEPKKVPVSSEQRCSNPRCITRTEVYLPVLTHKSGGREYCDYCGKEIE
jgi:aspartate carbamoyltransferase catalytic subunit